MLCGLLLCLSTREGTRRLGGHAQVVLIEMMGYYCIDAYKIVTTPDFIWVGPDEIRGIIFIRTPGEQSDEIFPGEIIKKYHSIKCIFRMKMIFVSSGIIFTP